jgi:hypothetical protein
MGTYVILFGKPLGDLVVDGRMMLKWMFKDQDVNV